MICMAMADDKRLARPRKQARTITSAELTNLCGPASVEGGPSLWSGDHPWHVHCKSHDLVATWVERE